MNWPCSGAICMSAFSRPAVSSRSRQSTSGSRNDTSSRYWWTASSRPIERRLIADLAAGGSPRPRETIRVPLDCFRDCADGLIRTQELLDLDFLLLELLVVF